ncbi:signal peptidase I [Thermosulfurimonas dismutans]|uniref:Signal peptidase I n=1 Tax=Thermosulfurimonas dismutans TaxID=999894 RepID=A0A179D5I7_9BACT|nr:signal peptidase I [Thermosulfurimonas dismutans]OAQ21364.1 Signal peptidase I [Thermosulfurimonas dismutans]
MSQKKDFWDKVWEWVKSIVLALILALFIRTFFVQAYKIPSGSMIPTLLIGDHILVNKFVYGVRNPFNRDLWIKGRLPKRQEIIVFIYPKNRKLDFIKRVIGLPGDVIEIRNKQVWVNGQPLNEPYVQHTDPKILPPELSPRDNFGPVKVPPGHLFVMGDNRDESYDSRFWGFVPIRDVKGKAFIIYFSWDPKNFHIRFRRIGRLIH